MSKSPNKNNKNIYLNARLEASKENNVFLYRQDAALELGISLETLAKYERDDFKNVPIEKVVLMSEAYNSPELLNHYCCNECPIGRKTVQPIENENIDNLYRFAVLTSNDLQRSKEVQDTLLRIIQDGIIDESEYSDLDSIIGFFTRLERRSSELRILAEKHVK